MIRTFNFKFRSPCFAKWAYRTSASWCDNKKERDNHGMNIGVTLIEWLKRLTCIQKDAGSSLDRTILNMFLFL